REQPTGAQELASGLALGVFIGNLPAYGFHTLLSFYTARRLHLNPLAVVAGSHISTPPLGPVLVAAAIGVGHWLIHRNWMALTACERRCRIRCDLVGIPSTARRDHVTSVDPCRRTAAVVCQVFTPIGGRNIVGVRPIME